MAVIMISEAHRARLDGTVRPGLPPGAEPGAPACIALLAQIQPR